MWKAIIRTEVRPNVSSFTILVPSKIKRNLREKNENAREKIKKNKDE